MKDTLTNTSLLPRNCHLRQVLVTTCCYLLLWLPAGSSAQVDFSTRTPLALFDEMAADTVSAALFNHYTPHPELKFTVGSPAPGVDLTGETNTLIALDFNNDGFEDVFQGNRSFPGEEFSKLLINQGDGSFLPLQTSAIPHGVVAAAAGDLDNDGWIDLVLVTGTGGHRVKTWQNVKAPTIQTRLFVLRNRHGVALEETQELYSGTGPRVANWVHPVLMDFNQDSYLDLVTTLAAADHAHSLMLWPGRQEGFAPAEHLELSNKPAPATPRDERQKGRPIPLLATMDYDGDGDQDLLLQESGFLPYRPRYLRVMINDTNGWQAPVAVPVAAVSRQTPPILADYNNDGRFEFFFGRSDFAGGRSALCVRDSLGSLVDVGQQAGLWVGYNYTSSAVWADWNNDGWLDLLQCLAFNEGAWTESTIYLNEAGSYFSNISERATPDLGPGSRAAVSCDVEHDGDWDVILGHKTDYTDIMPLSATGLDLVRNESTVGNWLAIHLEGTVSNRAAIGSLVRLYAGPDSWLQAVPNGVFWGVSQPPLTAHFGLAQRAAVDSVVVVWPNGVRENFGHQVANQRLTLREGATQTGTRKSRGPHHP